MGDCEPPSARSLGALSLAVIALSETRLTVMMCTSSHGEDYSLPSLSRCVYCAVTLAKYIELPSAGVRVLEVS